MGLVSIQKICYDEIIKEKIKVIEEIRRSEFGINLETDSDARSVINKQNERLNRALEELSEGLYSENTHFVLELIQNADDNKYNTENPKAIFIYNTEKIIINNNEIGFTDADVKAICDIGKSNKIKTLGYIGEKGIGFKSVFKISDEPQIYSNCFRFKFNRKDKEYKLGFVVPIWIQYAPESIGDDGTTIILPFNEEFKTELKKLDDVKDPMLLVFLNKLTKLDIWDQVKNEKHCFDKDGMNDSITIRYKIEYEERVDEKKFVWKKINYLINTAEIKEDKRKDVKESHIILAFPLNDDGTSQIARQKIFAFLPIKKSEFKFVIQADFILISNREDIDFSKRWNLKIRDNISAAFIHSLTIFKKDEQLKTTWYRYIPKKNEIIDDFFIPVIEDIYEKLAVTNCIFSDSESWIKPDEAIWASSEIQHLIPAKINGRQHYVHSEIKGDVKDTLEELGVKVQKEYPLLLTALKDNDFLKSRDNEWFNSLYEFLNEKIFIKKEWQGSEISKLPIIKAEDGNLEIPSKLFFKPANEQLKEYENIPVIKYVDLDGIFKKGKEFLEKIGVNDSRSLEIIKNRIIEAYKSDECESWNYEQHRNCSKHIEAWLNEKKWDISDYEINELGFIRVLTEKGLKRANECYFPDQTLRDILPKNAFFIKLLKNDADENRFFEKIGVWKIPKIIIKQEISIQSTYEVSDIEKYAKWLDKNGERDEFADDEQWHIPILEGFENCIQKKDFRVSRIYLTFLIENWNNYYSDFIKSDYEVFYKNNPVSTKPIQVQSYFAYKIKQAEWLSTNRGIMKPESGVFRSFEKIKQFSSDFPYLEIEKELLDKGKEFLDFLELGTEPDLNTLLNILRNIKNIDDKNLVFEIYRKIASELDNAGNYEINNSDTEDLYLLSTDGNFYPISELYWNDYSKAESFFKNIIPFIDIPEELGGHYQKLLFEDFFKIKRVSKAIETKKIETELVKVYPEAEKSSVLTEYFKEYSNYIEDVFSYNNIKYPEFFFKNIEIYQTKQIETRLKIKRDGDNQNTYQYTPIENIKVYCDTDNNKLYTISDKESDLAKGIEDSFGGKNIAVYIEIVLTLMNHEQIKDRLSKYGIKLKSERSFNDEEATIEIVESTEHNEQKLILEIEPAKPIKESLADRILRAYPENAHVNIPMNDSDNSQQKWDYNNFDFEADISNEIPHNEKKKIRLLLTERKKEVTDRVKRWYGYKCQICGESFETNSGNLYAEGHHFIPIKDEKECEDIDNLGNVLCVCPKCHSIMQYGKCKLVGINSKTKEWLFKKDDDGFYYLDIIFKGIIEKDNYVPEKNAIIKYNQKHLEHLQRFLEVYGNNDKIIVSGEHV